ncbi:ABC transporter ATP-binding protein [uncultured Corynebacterium sp.]|uniref:ABC transporter ATP-binding protein n=1 Tax=uncultured Corynebacterium sp. TaxID=159447 RepID=UPI0025D6E96E|nr:ABC transporter ATP-binding protein [uncultured Corynebacterium sp.]
MTADDTPTDAPTLPAIVVDKVVKRFGNKTAVNELSFSVERGMVLALLGPNGAGKTTTIEMCEGFTTPTSGEISVLGINPTTQPDQVRRRIGIMLQGGGSYSGIRVGEMLRLAASYNDNPHDPEWLLEIVGLKDARRTTYRRLSGGQQQRLSLALALIGRPEIIFLDEPTAGMDAQSRNMVWDLINDLRRDGVTVVLTTHLMDEAEALADHVIIIDQGQIVAQGTPEQLTSQGKELGGTISLETTAALDVETLVDKLKARGLEHVKVRASRPLAYTLKADPTPALISQITAAVAEQNVLISRLSTDHRSLEDVFLDITGKELRS